MGVRLIGVDIGTTNICAVLFSAASNKIEKLTCERNCPIKNSDPLDAVEDPDEICRIVKKAVDLFVGGCGHVDALSISSQMHGIVYVDKNGNAVSPFYTWQNLRGVQKAKQLSEILGYAVHSGYGIVTHNLVDVPKDAACFCSIADYVLMRLANKKIPRTDITLAASMGIIDLKNQMITDRVSRQYFPCVEARPAVIGQYGRLPLVTGIGDNQASFLGAVGNLEGALLLNYGTGGQISYFSKDLRAVEGFESRPLGCEGFLNCAFSLSGGDAYRTLANFFKKTLGAFNCRPPDDIFEVMNKMGNRKSSMKCEATFMGKRGQSEGRGSFYGITRENFTPQDMVGALVMAMADELFNCYALIPQDQKDKLTDLYGAGGGLKKNLLLQSFIEDKYRKKLRFSNFDEEGCVGAVINAGVGISLWSDYHEGVAAVHS